jgi:predicted permease
VIAIEGRPPAAAGEQLIVDQREVTPDYFPAMRIRVLAGRAFTDRDDENGQGVAIVNRTMAARFWPREDPVGRRVSLTVPMERTDWLTVVGVSDDVKHTAIRRDAVPEMYRPLAQRPKPELTFVVRGRGDPSSLLPAIRERSTAIDSRLPLFNVQTMRERVEKSNADTRIGALLLGLLASLALVLAAIGIYGALWCSVAERTRDLGIRLALGAGRAAILRMVLGEAFMLTCAGLAIGLAGALATTRLMASLLFDTQPTDPLTLISTLAALLVLAMAAALVPSVRAMCVDPVIALRGQA